VGGRRRSGNGANGPCGVGAKETIDDTSGSFDGHNGLDLFFGCMPALSGSKSANDQAVSSQAVTLNVPGMSRDLNLTQLQAQWVVSAYSLAYACGLLFSGRIADVYGRKLCYLIGMGIFVLFNIISGVMRVSSTDVQRILTG